MKTSVIVMRRFLTYQYAEEIDVADDLEAQAIVRQLLNAIDQRQLEPEHGFNESIVPPDYEQYFEQPFYAEIVSARELISNCYRNWHFALPYNGS